MSELVADNARQRAIQQAWLADAGRAKAIRDAVGNGSKSEQKGLPPVTFETKDSGERTTFDTGMQRDVTTGKPRFDLVVPEGIPYDQTMGYRHAMLMSRGAEKYGDRNWEKARTEEELHRFKQSAYRHFMQYYHGETDEDHASAVFFNITGAEFVKYHQAVHLKYDREVKAKIKAAKEEPA